MMSFTALCWGTGPARAFTAPYILAFTFSPFDCRYTTMLWLEFVITLFIFLYFVSFISERKHDEEVPILSLP